jgi:hypothetical protein
MFFGSDLGSFKISKMAQIQSTEIGNVSSNNFEGSPLLLALLVFLL